MDTDRKNPLKRLHMESNSDQEQVEVSFLDLLLLESREEVPLTKVSPFLVRRVTSSVVNPNSVKNLKNGTILIEISNK